MMSLGGFLASFPGPAQLSVACSRFSVLQANESWAGPGNEASSVVCSRGIWACLGTEGKLCLAGWEGLSYTTENAPLTIFEIHNQLVGSVN